MKVAMRRILVTLATAVILPAVLWAGQTSDKPAPQILAELPKPGKVVEKSFDQRFKITHAWLENGVRVHHRFMADEPHRVYVSITLAGGQIEETAQNAGITQAAGLIFRYPATSRLIPRAFAHLLAGKDVQLGAKAEDDVFSVELATTPDDLEVGLQKAFALLTDGQIRKGALKRWKKHNVNRLTMFVKKVKFHAVSAMDDMLTNSDPRRTIITKERLEAQTAEQAQAWFDHLRLHAPIEVAVVGDIPLDKAMPLIERYVGSLPKRKRTADDLKKLRHAQRPKGPLSRRVEYETATTQAMVITGFFCGDDHNMDEFRALQAARLILDKRMGKQLRDEKKWTTSVRCNLDRYWAYEAAMRFHAVARCTPKTIEQLTKGINQAFQDFADKGPTPSEWADVQKELETFYGSPIVDSPTTWWRLLQYEDLHRRDIKGEREMKEAYEKMTAADVHNVFKKYYVPDRRYQVMALPKKTEENPTKQPGT